MGNKVSPFFEEQNPDNIIGYMFKDCKCGSSHLIHTERPNRNGAKWSFNGDLRKPTFSPSINSIIEFGAFGKPNSICHFFIRDGKIEYLGDCTHDFAGKTVDMWDFEGNSIEI